MSFQAIEHLPGVWQIADPMGVCCTLLVGETGALLVDAGYGLEDISAFAGTLTDKPVRLLLTHGHHDHALGAMDFDAAWLFPEDEAVYRTYTAMPQRLRVADSAAQNGRVFDRERFLTAPVPETAAPPECVDLGGLTARIILCPAHTPGSAAVFVPERKLLLTGDDWNPVTWLFFPESLTVWQYREHVRRLTELPFEHVLCSHRQQLFPAAALTSFLDGLTDGVIMAAEPSGEGAAMGIATVTAHPSGDMILVFDSKKRDCGGEQA